MTLTAEWAVLVAALCYLGYALWPSVRRARRRQWFVVNGPELRRLYIWAHELNQSAIPVAWPTAGAGGGTGAFVVTGAGVVTRALG